MQQPTLIERFANPDLIKAMPLGEKMLASLYVTLLGMAITFVALIILWGMIALMSRVLGTKPAPKAAAPKAAPAVQAAPAPAEPAPEAEADGQLIAVISAAIAASLETSIHNIVVTGIRRTDEQTPAWGRMGRLEQMKTRVQ